MATLNFFKLPNEIKHHILSFLDYAELRRLKEARNSNDQNISKGRQYTIRSLSTHIDAVIGTRQSKKRLELREIINAWEEEQISATQLQSQLIDQAKDSGEGASIVLFEEEFRKHILLQKKCTHMSAFVAPFSETTHFKIGSYIKDIALAQPWSIPLILEDEKLLKYLLVCVNYHSVYQNSNEYQRHNNLVSLILAHPQGLNFIEKLTAQIIEIEGLINTLIENNQRDRSSDCKYYIDGWEYSRPPIAHIVSMTYAVIYMKHYFGIPYAREARYEELFQALKNECLDKLYAVRPVAQTLSPH
jgi:hypothetical protein